MWAVRLITSDGPTWGVLDTEPGSNLKTKGSATTSASDEHCTDAMFLGQADELLMFRSGDGPSYDLHIRRGRSRVTLSSADITKTTFLHLPGLDTIVFVDGDAGTTTSRALNMVPLEPLRELTAAGENKPLHSVDMHRVLAGPKGIDLDYPGFDIFPVEKRSLACFWNTPRANPAVAMFTAFTYQFYEPGEGLSGTPVQYGKTLEIEGLWAIDATAGRNDAGELVIAVLGVARRRRDFVPAVAVFVSEVDADVYSALLTGTFTIKPIDQRIRNNASILTSAPLPDGAGFLAALEYPDRSKHFVRIDLSNSGEPSLTELDGHGLPKRIDVFADAPEPDAVDDDEEAEDTDLVMVRPGGCEVALEHEGEPPWPRVYVVGDGDGAGLSWWVSEDNDDDDVSYTLHLDARREVHVRVIL